jgi:hypothetical protein
MYRILRFASSLASALLEQGTLQSEEAALADSGREGQITARVGRGEKSDLFEEPAGPLESCMTSFGPVFRFTTESFWIHDRIVFDSHKPIFTYYKERLLRHSSEKMQMTTEDRPLSDQAHGLLYIFAWTGILMNHGARRSRPKPAGESRKYGRRKRTCSPSRRPDERTGLTRYDELTLPSPTWKGEDPVFLCGEGGLSIPR